jgi:hypothetical protein
MKRSIKYVLHNLGIYEVSRNIFKKIYYPYKYYKVKSNAKSILKISRKVFENKSLDYWLDYGTLLGYVREGAIIKNDIDLDFGVLNPKNIKLVDIFAQHNIHLVQQTIVEEKIAVEQYEYNGVGFDVFYYREEEAGLVTNIWYANDYTIPQKVSYKKGLCSLSEITFTPIKTKQIEFYGILFRIPKNAEKYLSENYGDDFMIPNSNWSHHDEKNRVVVDKIFEVKFYG